jgi:superfamily II DNA or RNA helicase
MHPVMFQQCGAELDVGRTKPSAKHLLKIVRTDFESMEESFPALLGEMVLCQKRNRQIVQEVSNLHDRYVLVLSERIEHLNLLYHLLHDRGIDVALLHGSMSRKLQREMRERLGRTTVILSTSSYIGEGMDLGHLDCIVLTMPVSYPERMVQYLGRIGRRGQQCIAIDFVDEKVPMLKASYRKRKGAYRRMGYLEIASEERGLFAE